MGFLIGAALVIGLLYAMVQSPSFRKFVLGLAVIAGLGIWALVAYTQHDADKRDAQERAAAQEAQSAIRLSEIELTDVALHPDNSFPTISGTIHNHARRDLKNLGLLVQLTRCDFAAGAKGCEVISEDRMWLDAAVPAGQARDFNQTTRAAANTKGDWTWSYKVTGTEAAPLL
jgi:hypothetical protein